MRRIIRHFIFIAAALMVCLGIPGLYYYRTGTLFHAGIDAVSAATAEIPDQPSGQFVVLLNTEKHPLTEAEWTAFFSEQDVDVIMEDIRCFVSRDDAAGIELAERYRARLAENQMKIRSEDGTLIASRAGHSLFDVIILSKESAEQYGYSSETLPEQVRIISVEGVDE